MTRALEPGDIVIADGSGAVSLAGTMGGLTTEISDETTDVLIEAAHFSPVGVAKMARRHRLHSEASYRFERGVDRELPLRASAKAVALLASLGSGTIVPGCQHASVDVPPTQVSMTEDYPDQVAGVVYGLDTVTRRLRQLGCATEHDHAYKVLTVTAPSWRSDLNDPADLAEEVIRLEGYENVPVRRPRAFAGRGLTTRQRLRRDVGRGLAGAGYVEVLAAPFVSAADADALQLPPEDPRRQMLALANPLSDDEPLLRTTPLPGLFRVLNRNIGRGFADVALFELGLVYLTRPGGRGRAAVAARGPGALVRGPDRAGGGAARPAAAPGRGAGRRPRATGLVGPGPSRVLGRRRRSGPPDRPDLPGQRGRARHRAGPLAPGPLRRDLRPGRRRLPADRMAGRVRLRVAPAGHPGLRPARQDQRAGAGHVGRAGRGGTVRSGAGPGAVAYPLAAQDVALIVDAAVPAADVEAALRAGAATAGDGALLEDVRLFDVYTGEQVGEGRKSLAYALRFRAPDRTLTAAEVAEVRDAAVAEAGERVGAELRG